MLLNSLARYRHHRHWNEDQVLNTLSGQSSEHKEKSKSGPKNRSDVQYSAIVLYIYIYIYIYIISFTQIKHVHTYIYTCIHIYDI